MKILRVLILVMVTALAVIVFVSGAPAVATALEVAGVDVPDSVSLEYSGGKAGNDSVLNLNGAGIRKKFFIKVYVGALYLSSSAASVEAALSMPGAKRVLMHFLYKKVSTEKLNAAWDEGFSANLSASEFESLRARLEKFKSFFPDMHKGESIVLDYLPGKGTEVIVNDVLAGTIEGEDFIRALLLVWLGDHPADKGLKKGMLGH